MTVGELKKKLENMPDDLPVECINANGDRRPIQAFPHRYEDLNEEEQSWYNGEGLEEWEDVFIITPW